MATETKRWVQYRSAGYLVGKGIVLGADYEVFPKLAYAPEHYAIYVDDVPNPCVAVCDSDLSTLVNDAFDYVFVGPRLGLLPDPFEVFANAVRKLKVGGHLIVHLPCKDTPEKLPLFEINNVKAFLETLGSWVAKDFYERHNTFLQIFKRVRGPKGIVQREVSSSKRACIARYGAIGDMIMVTPLIRALAEDGYEVTVNTTSYSVAVLLNNPFVSNIILQEKECIPNHHLGEYWDEWKNDYDRYINLSESIEGRLLKVEGRREFYTSKQWRDETCTDNYYDFTLKLGGCQDITGRLGELYFSRDEERFGKRLRDQYRNNFLIVWALNGSSHHKIYGYLEPVVSEWLDKHPTARCITVGDGGAKAFEFDHPQVIKKAGEWSLRQSLAAAKYVDVVVGPESMMTNAAGCFDTPKVVFLSHSTKDNLTKYWKNCWALEPDLEIAPCYPCHQLHYDRFGSSCPIRQLVNIETGKEFATLPACAVAIQGERVHAALDEIFAKRIAEPVVI